MGADRNKPDFRQDLLDIGGLKAVEACQLNAVIADLLDLGHNLLEVLRGLLQKIPKTVYLYCNRKMLAHRFPPCRRLCGSGFFSFMSCRFSLLLSDCILGDRGLPRFSSCDDLQLLCCISRSLSGVLQQDPIICCTPFDNQK